MSYEARKHAQKEAEMHPEKLVEGNTIGARIEHAAEVAYILGQDDPENFKAGYTFANAVLAACEMEHLESQMSVACVAEKLHEMLS